MRSIIKNISRMFIVLVVSAVVLVALMTLVYKLPVDSMARHVAESEWTLRAQNDEATLQNTGYYDFYDTGTNIIILHEIIYPNSNSPLNDAMLNPTADYYKGTLNEWIDNLISHASDREYTDADNKIYPRYWHGYLVVLKPLFMLFNLKQIYIINAVILALINVMILIMLYKRLGNYAMAYLLFGLLMNPLHIAFSFQLSAVFYVLSISMLLLLAWDKSGDDESWWIRKDQRIYYVFLIDGMLLSAIDFLTYPLVAYAIVLLTYILLGHDKSVGHEFSECIKTGMSFGMGYGGFWALKWVAATLFTKENVIADGLANVMHRVGAKEMSEDVLYNATPSMSLKVNFDIFFNIKTGAVFLVLIVFTLVLVVIKKNRLKINRGLLFITALVALSPIAWLILVYNHCAIHPFLEWRELGILFYAVAVFLISLTEEGESGK